jgi:dTDP-4-dehydrorhamnose reductase
MIAVLGAGGLLGSTICKLYAKDVVGFSHKELDIRHKNAVKKTLSDLQPDVVINCAGLTSHNKSINSKGAAVQTNSDAPWKLSEICSSLGIRLIHISTDCVFDGHGGPYSETSPTNGKSVYSWTKMRGEFLQSPHLVIRTSFVGLPDPNGRGLLAWLHRQHRLDEAALGYINVMWNGLTVDALADILVELAYMPRVWGIRHIFGPQVMSKKTLLEVVSSIYGWNVNIVPASVPVSSRILISNYDDVPYPESIYRGSFAHLVAHMRKRLGDV